MRILLSDPCSDLALVLAPILALILALFLLWQPNKEGKDVEKTTRLVVERGIAEALSRTRAWLCTGGHTGGLGTRLAGLAVRYACRELQLQELVCVGVVDFDDVRQQTNRASLHVVSPGCARMRPCAHPCGTLLATRPSDASAAAPRFRVWAHG